MGNASPRPPQQPQPSQEIATALNIYDTGNTASPAGTSTAAIVPNESIEVIGANQLPSMPLLDSTDSTRPLNGNSENEEM